MGLSGGECDDVNEFLDRLSGNASVPNITAQPQGGAAAVGIPHSIFVTASVTDGGRLQYQWYSNSSASNLGGWMITGAIDSVLSVPTSSEGTLFYYVVVTNTNSKVSGNVSASAKSNAVTVTVGALTNAQAPLITGEPQDVSAEINGNAQLSAAANVNDGGTLSFQWYQWRSAGSEDDFIIAGATGQNYTVPSDETGTFYYYVKVTNTNNEVSGIKTTVSTSRVARAEITAAGVVNASPVNISGPANARVNEGENLTLSVTAATTDDGTLSYQWYVNDIQSNTDGRIISGETGSSYVVPTDTGGIYYYYVSVTNTNTNVNGEQTAVSKSRVAVVTIDQITNAEEPLISSHPQTTTVTQHAEHSISVAAGISGAGMLTFQWYSNTVNSNSGGTEIPGADAKNPSFTVNTSTPGTIYYYVMITNTRNDATGSKTASVTSNPAAITVSAQDLIHARQPEISSQPLPTAVTVNTSFSLSVSALAPDAGTGGRLSYQWYMNTSGSNTGGTLLAGATSAIYTASISEPGLYYYYVVITNTNNSVNGNKTAETRSNAVMVSVNRTYTLTVTTVGVAGGVPGTVTPDMWQYTVTAQQEISITATAADGYKFIKWTVTPNGAGTFTDSTNSSTTVRITGTGNLTVWASFEQVSGTFTDPRDPNNSYKWVKIGSKRWMAQNMNFTTTNNITDSSWCYESNSGNCNTYGRLYNWSAATSACPAGWSLPTIQDVNNLISEAGGFTVAGGKLKSKTGWGASGNGTDDFGFSAMPGGERDPTAFTAVGLGGYWWTGDNASGDNTRAESFVMNNNNNNLISSSMSKLNGRSVRCVQ